MAGRGARAVAEGVVVGVVKAGLHMLLERRVGEVGGRQVPVQRRGRCAAQPMGVSCLAGKVEG